MQNMQKNIGDKRFMKIMLMEGGIRKFYENFAKTRAEMNNKINKIEILEKSLKRRFRKVRRIVLKFQKEARKVSRND